MTRVSHGLPMAPYGIAYRRVRRLPLHRLPLAPAYWQNRYAFLPRPSVDAMHFFNGICVAKIPWVSSIEMEFPRYFGRVTRAARVEAFERMASEDCRLLLPLSEAARRHLLRRTDDRWLAAVEKKTTVFAGGVRVPDRALAARDARRASSSPPFTIGFVGRLFWHKGGPAVLEAVERLRARGADVRLVVVSDLSPKSHIIEVDASEVARMRDRLRTTPWIEYHADLPNEEVLVRMAGCDVFAFPTFDESLGWVAIEAIALGLPTVTTNVFAIPEIVENGVEGIAIELPRDQDGRWRGITDLNPAPRPTYAETHRVLVEGCAAAFERLLDDPELRRKMGDAGRRKFVGRFDEPTAATRLAELFRGALS